MGKPPMAFYHEDGLVPTWHLAQQYIGDEGRVATLPDIIEARLATEPGTVPWETFFTTTTSEYLGRDPEGKLVLAVVHGVGPMAMLDGIMAAYKHEYGDKSRRSSGGRITEAEFRKIESGEYGEVFVVDFADYIQRYRYPFGSYLTADQLLTDPLLYARLGGEERARRYVEWHREHAAKWHDEESDRANPFLLELGGANYKHRLPEAGFATARLLSIGRLANVNHADESSGQRSSHRSLACEIGVFDWWNGCRFVGVPAGSEVASIHPGWDLEEMLVTHWESLMVPYESAGPIGLRLLQKLGDYWFVQYVTKGYSTATGEPEFLVTEIEPTGSPIEFKTKIHGYYGIFRYDIQDVRAVAPPDATGFTMGKPEFVEEDGTEYHRIPVQFYRVEIDMSRQLRRRKDLAGDFETQQRLIATDAS